MRSLSGLIQKLVGAFTGHRNPARGRRQHFDENLAREQWDLLEAAALLQVTEFRVFEMAYREWYGVRARQYLIEKHFRDYMFHRVVPGWVSHFARRIVALSQAGELDPRDFGIYGRLPSRRMMRVGQVYAAMLLVAFLMLVYMAYGDAWLSGLTLGHGPFPVDPGLPDQNILP